MRDVIRLSTGLIGTMAALVLGLLIASAKSSYDAKSTQIKQITANIILLDLELEQYGPDAQNLRIVLRNAIPPLIDRIWSEGDRAKLSPFTATVEAAEFVKKLQQLQPNNDVKRALQAELLSATANLSTSAFVAVHSVERCNSSAVSCDPHILACNYFCKLRTVCPT